MTRYREADFSRLTVGSVRDRETRVRVEEFARPLDPAAARAVIASLPDQLAARALRDVIARVVAAHRASRPVLALLGGHVIKVGISPCLIALMERRVITHLAMNGAAAIHDVEIALEGRARSEGLGEAWGRALAEAQPAHAGASLLAAAFRLGIPATVHVAIGTDTIHHHPRCDGAALGETTLRDFRILAATLAEARGAVALNLGSAVIMPEVFLKALSVARNLGADLAGLTAVNFDQIQHYRPRVNLVERPTRAEGARGFALTGHHEILFPLFAAGVLAEIGN